MSAANTTMPEETGLNPANNRIWARWTARFIDNSVSLLIAALVLYFFQSKNGILLFFAYLFISMLIETLSLMFYGTTMGKKCFSIAIKTNNGHEMGFEVAFKRTFGCKAVGQWFGVHYLGLIPGVMAGIRAIKNMPSAWDDYAGTSIYIGKFQVYFIFPAVFVSFLLRAFVIRITTELGQDPSIMTWLLIILAIASISLAVVIFREQKRLG